MGALLRRPARLVLAGFFLMLVGGWTPAAAWEEGPNAAAISPDGARLYVANNLLNTIAVVDTATNRVAAVVPLDPLVPVIMAGMALSPDGSRLYVSAWDGRVNPTGGGDPLDPFGPLPGSVSVIDTASLQVVSRIQAGSSHLLGLAISRDGKRVYVADFDGSAVSVIDTTANRVVATAQVGLRPRQLALSPDGTRLYVGNDDDSKAVLVLDPANLGVIARVGTGFYPIFVAPSPDGKWVYATGYAPGSGTPSGGRIAIIDAGANRIVGQVMTDANPLAVAFSPDSSRAYVTVNTMPGTVAVIGTAAKQVIDVIQAGYFSPHLVMRPDGKRLYTIDLGATTVTAIDTGTDQVVAKVPVYLQSAAAGQ